MRFHRVLSEIAGSQAKARILETILNLPSKSWTGRQLAIKSGVSQSQANAALKTLKEYGIVDSMRAGAAVVWTVNVKHVICAWLQKIASAERQIPAIIAEELDKEITLKNKVDKVIMFGSVARGEERPDSDIDILVITKNPADKDKIKQGVINASARLLSVLGNPLVPVVYSRLEAKRKNNSRLMRAIHKDGIILYDGELA